MVRDQIIFSSSKWITGESVNIFYCKSFFFEYKTNERNNFFFTPSVCSEGFYGRDIEIQNLLIFYLSTCFWYSFNHYWDTTEVSVFETDETAPPYSIYRLTFPLLLPLFSVHSLLTRFLNIRLWKKISTFNSNLPRIIWCRLFTKTLSVRRYGNRFSVYSVPVWIRSWDTRRTVWPFYRPRTYWSSKS